MPRVVPDNSEVFVCAVRVDLAGMKLLFEQRIASPLDIGVGTGRSALHYAVNYDHIELAGFLVHAGANAHTPDLENASAVAIAWRRIFGALSGAAAKDVFGTMFDDEEFLESRVFQPLHKIVLAISTMNLEQQLELSTSSINDVDADDHPCPIIQDLIDHGAQTDAIDFWNRTALTYASGNHTSLAPVQLLVDHRTPLDVRDRRLRTALGYAVRLGNLLLVEYLPLLGADPNLPDEFNVLPLLDAVKNNYHDMLTLLIPVSCPIEIHPFGSTLLHWIARYGDQTTFKIFQKSPQNSLFSQTATTDLDKMAFTAQDVFDQRLRLSESDKTAFALLIQKISGPDSDSDDESDGIYEFLDAEENFQV
ncbi:ankyrin [Cadophora sp. DSE1049]|nr:ankyrin [Cadophora sp. DSE1049]